MSALPPQYEFNQEQSSIIGNLAATMSMVGWILLSLGAVIGAIGVFQILSGFHVVGAADVAQGLAFFLSGIWVGDAARRFRAVADTRGQDISNLMDALIQLHRVFGLQRILLAFALVFSAIAALMMVLLPAS